MKLYDVKAPMLFLGFVLGGIFGGSLERTSHEETKDKYGQRLDAIEERMKNRVIRVEQIGDCPKPSFDSIYGSSDEFFKTHEMNCPKCDCTPYMKDKKPTQAKPIGPKPNPKMLAPPKNQKLIDNLKKRVKELPEKLNENNPPPRLDNFPPESKYDTLDDLWGISTFTERRLHG